jgi:hypothetical protein
VTPQVRVTAASTASTATAGFLAALQKRRTKKHSARFDEVVMSAENHVATDGISSMQSQQQQQQQQQQQHLSTQVEGKLKISVHIYSTIRDYESSNLYFAFGKIWCVTLLFQTSRVLLVASFGARIIIQPACIAVLHKY